MTPQFIESARKIVRLAEEYARHEHPNEEPFAVKVERILTEAYQLGQKERDKVPQTKTVNIVFEGHQTNLKQWLKDRHEQYPLGVRFVSMMQARDAQYGGAGQIIAIVECTYLSDLLNKMK